MLIPFKAATLAALFAWTVVLIPAQFAAVALRLPIGRAIPVMYHRALSRMLHVRIDTDGEPADRPVLFVANHSSWLDIVVLSTIAPLSFVAKSEIAGWPGVRILAKLQRSVFVERRRGRTGLSRTEIGERLAAGDNIVLFAEGTAGDGNHVLPFKSALFAAAETGPGGREPWVQPVSIAYTHLDGLPLGRRDRHLMAWYGTMSLGSHLWNLLGHRRGRAQVTLHDPIRPSEFPSRKELAAHCQRVVSQQHARALAGSPPPTAPTAPAGLRTRYS